MDFEQKWFDEDVAFKKNVDERLDRIETRLIGVEQGEILCQTNHLKHVNDSLTWIKRIVIGLSVVVLVHVGAGGDVSSIIQFIKAVIG